MLYDKSVKSACCSNTQSVDPIKCELATLSSTLLHRFVVISSWQRLEAVCTVMLGPLFCQLHDLSLLPGVHSTPSMMRMHAGSTGQQHRPAVQANTEPSQSAFIPSTCPTQSQHQETVLVIRE